MRHSRAILGSDEKVKEIIISELKEISKKYGKERKTAVISAEEITEYNEEGNNRGLSLKAVFNP